MAQVSIVIALLVLASLVELGTTDPNSMTCGHNANCKNKVCTCLKSTMSGKADFACYDPAVYQFCSISSDPMLDTFDDQESRIRIPASLSLTNLTTRRIASNGGKCHLRVNAWSKRFGGKYFIEGLEFSLTQKWKSGQSFGGATYRVIAKVDNNGDYVWEIYKQVLVVWKLIYVINKNTKPITPSKCDGCRINIQQEPFSKFLVIHITCCSLKFAIRPFNPDKPKIVPGVWIMARQWVWTNPLPYFLCNSNKNGPKIEDLVKKYSFKTKSQVITYIALMRGRPLKYPRSSIQLDYLQTALTLCSAPRRTNFMTKAAFLFDDGKLIACMKYHMNSLIFNVAVGYCYPDKYRCGNAIRKLKYYCPNAKDDNEQIDAFMKNGCV